MLAAAMVVELIDQPGTVVSSLEGGHYIPIPPRPSNLSITKPRAIMCI